MDKISFQNEWYNNHGDVLKHELKKAGINVANRVSTPNLASNNVPKTPIQINLNENQVVEPNKAIVIPIIDTKNADRRTEQINDLKSTMIKIAKQLDTLSKEEQIDKEVVEQQEENQKIQKKTKPSSAAKEDMEIDNESAGESDNEFDRKINANRNRTNTRIDDLSKKRKRIQNEINTKGKIIDKNFVDPEIKDRNANERNSGTFFKLMTGSVIGLSLLLLFNSLAGTNSQSNPVSKPFLTVERENGSRFT